jgi:hypothetical protein
MPLKNRRSPRSPAYDYATPGAYFVTICTHEREPLFGDIVDGEMRPNTLGTIVVEEWQATGRLRSDVRLDAFVVMPNHVHAIIWIGDESPNCPPCRDAMHRVHGSRADGPPIGAGNARGAVGAAIAGSLSAVVGTFKASVTRRIRGLEDDPDLRVWQGRYHDRVVRTDEELERIRTYIADNPARWADDDENPSKTRLASATALQRTAPRRQ